jgi:hypothetical protein
LTSAWKCSNAMEMHMDRVRETAGFLLRCYRQMLSITLARAERLGNTYGR